MDNPEKLATLGTQDTGRRQTKQKYNTICVRYKLEETNKTIIIRVDNTITVKRVVRIIEINKSIQIRP